MRTRRMQQAADEQGRLRAASLFEDKVKACDIRSASGRVKWAQTLEHHLLPAFGSLLLDQIRHADIAKWRVRMAGFRTYDPYRVKVTMGVTGRD